MNDVKINRSEFKQRDDYPALVRMMQEMGAFHVVTVVFRKQQHFDAAEIVNKGELYVTSAEPVPQEILLGVTALAADIITEALAQELAKRSN